MFSFSSSDSLSGSCNVCLRSSPQSLCNNLVSHLLLLQNSFFQVFSSLVYNVKTVRGKIGEKCSKGKEKNACGLTKGCSSMPGSAIPSDWSILTSFVNS